MVKNITLVYLLFICFNTLAQNKLAVSPPIQNLGLQPLKPVKNIDQTINTYMDLSSGNTIDTTHLAHKMLDLLGLGSNFRLVKTSVEKDDLGYEHIRWDIYHGQYPLFNRVVISHTSGGRLTALNTNLKTKPKIDLSANLTPEKTNGIALEQLKGVNCGKEKLPNPEKVLIEISHKEGYYALCHSFIVCDPDSAEKNVVFVNAYSGHIEKVLPVFHTGCHHPTYGTQQKAPLFNNHLQEILDEKITFGKARTTYYGIREITTTQKNGLYLLNDYTRGEGIYTYVDDYFLDRKEIWDQDNFWDDSYNTMSFDVHWAAATTYDYYFQKHNRNSYDNKGAKLVLNTHWLYGNENAAWDYIEKEFYFGEGLQQPKHFRSFSSLDVVGHEITHAVTSSTARLEYSDESGAINEAFSDIMGYAILENKFQTHKYLIGDGIRVGGGALRSMKEPSEYGCPDTYQGFLWRKKGTSQSEIVHANSGVGNHWFYLLCEGGKGANDLGIAYNVVGLGIETATKIAYRTLTVYLTPTSTYQDFRMLSQQAAIDLFGSCSKEVTSVNQAWKAVGLLNASGNTAIADFMASDTSYCSYPARVEFRNYSSNAKRYLWDFGDGSTSTDANPSHTYLKQGIFTVSLTVNGDCGSQTTKKEKYIKTNVLTSCKEIEMPRKGSGDVQTSCEGDIILKKITDYVPDGIQSIIVPNASNVKLHFSNFSLDNGKFLYVYDGPNIHCPLIGQFKLNDLQNKTLSSSGNAITLRYVFEFMSQFKLESNFRCHWTCSSQSNQPLIPKFVSEKSVSCEAKVKFTDLSTGNPTSWFWDFGDNTYSSDQSPTKQYTKTGTYTVKLTICKDSKCETQIQTNAVVILDTLNCEYNTLYGSIFKSSFSCQGILQDNRDGLNYNNTQEDQTFWIRPYGAEKIKLTFKEFHLSTIDTLKIYDGDPAYSKLLGSYAALDLKNGDTIVSTSGKMVLRLKVVKNYFLPTESGFLAYWNCVPFKTLPIADFTLQDTIICNTEAVFIDKSASAKSWLWDFGDGNTSTAQNTVHSYQKPGTYTVRLTVCNDIGCDESIKSDIINVVSLASCDTIRTPYYTMPPITKCSGILTDNGGSKPYEASSSSVTIAPFGAKSIQLHFSIFDLSPDDKLNIYTFDSNDKKTLFASYSGQTLAGQNIMFASKAVVLGFDVPKERENQGFVCNWQCITDSLPPTAEIFLDKWTHCDSTVEYESLSTSGYSELSWDFGDGTTSEDVQGYKRYDKSGKYTVKLILCNGYGCDTASQDIQIELLPSCRKSSFNDDGEFVNISCSGTLKSNHDFNNSNKGYLASNATITIAPIHASSVTLRFDYFELNAQTDILYIYDGLSVSSPLIGAFTGNSIASNTTFTSSTGALTLRHIALPSTTKRGISAFWKCNQSDAKPIPDFNHTPLTTISYECERMFSFNNLTTGSANSWLWDFGDSTSSSEQNPIKYYSKAGTYTVGLKSCNDTLCQSIQKKNYIEVQDTKNCSHVTMVANKKVSIENECEGNLFDNGGILNYSDYATSTYTIKTGDAYKAVSVTFQVFDLEDKFDYLYIFDGESTLYSSIGSYTANELSYQTITSTGSALTLLLYTDAYTNKQGFQCSWKCQDLPKPSIPVVIKQEPEKDFLLYPNPNNGTFNIFYSFESHKQISLSIVNILGEEVYFNQGEYEQKFQTKIDLSGLANGIYILQLNDQSKQLKRAFIVNK